MVAERAYIDSRVNEVLTRIGANESVLTRVGAQVKDITTKLDVYFKRVEQTEDSITQLSVTLTANKATIDKEKEEVLKSLNNELDMHKATLSQVVSDARVEFDGVRRDINALFGGTGQGFQEVKAKVESLEQEPLQFRDSGAGGGGGAKHKGFLPIKEQLPGKFGKNEDEWRRWQEDVSEYLDTMQPGLRDVLKDAEKATMEISATWLQDEAARHTTCTPVNSVHLFRALRALTEAEARMVLQGVREENGFEAWRQLHQRFGLSVAAKQGQAMCHVTRSPSPPKLRRRPGRL